MKILPFDMDTRHLSLAVNGSLGFGIKDRNASDMSWQEHVHLGTMDLVRPRALRVLPCDHKFTDERTRLPATLTTFGSVPGTNAAHLSSRRMGDTAPPVITSVPPEST